LTYTQFNEATGSDSYSGSAGPDFGGASARHVLISAVDNWGEPDWFGLAEVKFNISVGVAILGSWEDETSDMSHAGESGD